MELSQVQEYLYYICRGKSSDWLSEEMTKEQAVEIRNMILEDYKGNSLSLVGVDALKVVLCYLAQFQ